MSPATPEAAERFTIICLRCDRPVIARRTWVGREVHCPHCYSVIRVPAAPADGRPVRADGPNVSTKLAFNFACPRCDCLLEAHTGMSGQFGMCPTCAARFRVPHLRGRSGVPQKAELVEGVVDTPTPLHAYAASGHQAPRIVQTDDGLAVIECPRCNAHNAIDADNCAACGAPFTMEAAATIGKLHRDRWAKSSLGLGVVGVLAFPVMLPAAVAVWLGLRSVMFAGSERRSVYGFVGLTLGLLSLIGGAAFWYWKLK